MKRLSLIAASVAVVAGMGAVAITSSFTSAADESAPEDAPIPTASPSSSASTDSGETETDTEVTNDDSSEGDDPSESDSNEEGKAMSSDTAENDAPEQSDDFKETMHTGDIALGACGARVSALLWAFEAMIAQGRDDLKPYAEYLKTSREAIKAEAERRAVDDGVDTTVRVMNAESEKLFHELEAKAASGDVEEYQKAQDELYAGVQECLPMFFDHPGDNKDDGADAKKEG